MTGFSLLKNTNAYKIFLNDKKSETLSHAYLIVCEDALFLEEYLKFFAKALVCSEFEPCNNCRTCNLVNEKNYTDVIFYPKGKKIVVSDVDELIEKSFYKPLEADKKVFVLSDMAKMNHQAQNKLLKTLEEPPKNTFILMGTTSLYPLLSTVLSRSKKLEIPAFSEAELFESLSKNCLDVERLNSAIRLSGGRVGEVLLRYESEVSCDVEALAVSALVNLKNSVEVLSFSTKINKDNLLDFISSLARLTQICLEKSLRIETNVPSNFENAVNAVLQNVEVGALVYISDKIRDAEKSVYFNGNLTAIVDGLLFGIVEGKYKWSK